ncbi:MAG: hypothetical protein ACYC9M_06565 [Desulfobulbaceae bacterium]
MNILIILKQEPDRTIQAIIEAISRKSEVTTIELPQWRDYDSLVDLLAGCDRVITW